VANLHRVAQGRIHRTLTAITKFSAEEKKVAKAVIESLILKHDSQRFSRVS
jgi:hypothetical protein